MARCPRLFPAFLVFAILAALPVTGQAPNAIGGPVATLSPFNFWSDPSYGRFYNPAVLVVGGSFFLYVHGGVYHNANGGPGSTCATSNEQVLVFETPYTRANVRSPAFGPPLYCSSGCPHPAQGAWTYVGTANPCSSSTPHHYQVGSAFRSSFDGQYKLLIDETDCDMTGTCTDWANGDFKRILLMTSSNGATWTPQLDVPFLAQSTIGGTVYSVTRMSIIQGASEWWGTFHFGTTCGCSLGRIRVFEAPSNVRGFVAYIWSTDSQWHAVNDDGTFNYVPMNTELPGMPLDVGALVSHLGGYEAWGNPYFTSNQPLDPKDHGCNDGSGNEATVYMSTIQEGTADTTSPPPALGTPEYITSSLDTNTNHQLNWPLPTLDSGGRGYPVRFDDTWGYLLFTSSLDAMCWAGLLGNTGAGMGIVLTTVDR